MKNILIISLLGLLVTSCMHPLGISDETWQKMTPEQQADAYKQQANIDAKERAQQLAYQQKQEQEIANIKANPRYGEYIQCVIENGKYKYFNDWNNMESFSIDAIKNKTTTSTLTYYRNNDKFFTDTQKLYVSMTGTKIKICDRDDNLGNCSTINSTLPQYQKGVKVNINTGIIKGIAQCDMIYDKGSDTGHSNIIINI